MSNKYYSYDHAQEIEAIEKYLDEYCDEPNLSEGLLKTLDDLKMLEQTELLAVVKRSKELEGLAENIKTAALAMVERQKKVERKAKTMQEAIKRYMEFRNLPSIEDAEISAKLKTNPPSVVILDETLVPKKFWVTPDPEISKKSIKEALADGKKVNGAALEQKTRLEVK